MIVTVTLNAAVDKTYTVEGFSLDRVHRPSVEKTAAGGKGINVARMLRTLGCPVLATGFIGGHNGEMIVDSLDREGVQYDFVNTHGESRLCIAVVDPTNVTQTEVNENGPQVSDEEVEALHKKIRALLPGAAHLIMSGSAPPGVPGDFYAEAVADAKAAGVTTLLDSSGEHLRQGIGAVPDIVKPNAAELAGYVGRTLCGRDDILDAAVSLVRTGIGIVVVSMGSDGAIATDGSSAWHAAPPEIEFVSAVGSGDSLVAAFIAGLVAGNDIAEALRAGTAAGAGNAMIYGAGFCTRDCVEQLMPQVTLTRLR